MTRRTAVLIVTILVLLLGSVVRTAPVSASHAHDIAPQDVDPRLFALPVDTLPPPADACLTGTQDASGTLTAAHVTPKGSQSENAIICGYVSDYKAATA